jgi:branched-subunit amino acid aminotransferase/4-amino-4-deoxychorismate lyase
MPRMVVQLFAVTAQGPVPLRTPPGATSAHELFDELDLGVYSALRTFEHARFLGLEHHFERTDRSLALLGWPERLARELLARAIDATVRIFPAEEAFVRFDLLAAPARALGSEERTLLALAPLVPVSPALLETGVTVRLSTLARPTPLIKTARFVLERRPYPLHRPDAYEHLIVGPDQRIREGTSSNFLALRGRELYYTGDEALQGVTQRYVVALARDLGLTPVRAGVGLAELATLEEAFLSGSTRGIVPVVAVEEQRIGAGRPGPWTRRLMQAYADFAHRQARAAWSAPAAARSGK